MAVQNSYNLFPLLSEAGINENTRPGTLLLEYFQATLTITSLEGTVEVPTQLEDCLGLIDFNFNSGAGGDPTDSISLLTDGVITTSAVTVDVTCLDISNGDITIRGFLVGTKRTETALLNSPT